MLLKQSGGVPGAPPPVEMDPAVMDEPCRRLTVSAIVSVLLNALIWSLIGIVALRHRPAVPPTVEVTRLVVDSKGHQTVKVVTPKQVRQRVQELKPQVVKMEPTPPPIVAPREQQVPPRPAPAQPPPQSHQLLAQDPAPAPNNQEPAVQNQGDAQQGRPTDNQSEAPVATVPSEPTQVPLPQPQTSGGNTNGNGQANVAPPATPTPLPPPPPTPTPLPTPTPVPTPTSVPTPTPTPRPAGPTRDAELVDEEKPDIPSELRSTSFKTYVRVAVDVAADGGSSPRLRTSSGNSQIDQLVLRALRHWTWKPALKDGQPVASTKYFKFEFLVE